MAAPTSIDEVLSGPFAEEWQAAMDAELALLDARAWVASDTREAIPSRWEYAYELDAAGDVLWRTATVVAIDPAAKDEDTKPPPPPPRSLFRSLRILLAIAAAESQQLCHVRLPHAHLGDTLPEPVYLQAPPGRTGVYKLSKAVPGLAGTQRAADEHIAEGLDDMGFEPLDADGAVYARNTESTHPTIVLVHGRELLVVAPSKLAINDMLIDLQFFHGKDDVLNFGYPRHFLGLRIDNHHPSRQIWLSQPGLLRRLCTEFPEVAALPDVYTAPEQDHAYDSLTPERYSALVAGLSHIANTTRPDVLLWASALQQEGGSPTHHDRASALTLLSHLRKSKSTALALGGKHDAAPEYTAAEPLAVYAHAAALVGNEVWQWGDVVHLLGSTVAWDSQRCTASQSIRHAELVGQHSAVRQAEDITAFLTQLGYERFTSAIIPVRACSTHVGPESDELPDEPTGATTPTRNEAHCVDTSSSAIASKLQQRRIRFIPPLPYCIGSKGPEIQYAEYMARLVDKAREVDINQYKYWVMQLGVVEPKPAGNNMKKVLEALNGLELEYTTDSVMG